MVHLEPNLSDILDVSFRMEMDHSLAVPILVTDYEGNSSDVHLVSWIPLTESYYWLKWAFDWSLLHGSSTEEAPLCHPVQGCWRQVLNSLWWQLKYPQWLQVPWTNPAETAKTPLDVADIVEVQELFLRCMAKALFQSQEATSFLLSGSQFCIRLFFKSALRQLYCPVCHL